MIVDLQHHSAWEPCAELPMRIHQSSLFLNLSKLFKHMLHGWQVSQDASNTTIVPTWSKAQRQNRSNSPFVGKPMVFGQILRIVIALRNIILQHFLMLSVKQCHWDSQPTCICNRPWSSTDGLLNPSVPPREPGTRHPLHRSRPAFSRLHANQLVISTTWSRETCVKVNQH